MEVSASKLRTKFIKWHGGVLLGYALSSRGFAYVGFPPLFIGEITLIFGLFAFIVGNQILFFEKVLNYLPAKILLVFMVWCFVNTIPYYPTYGLMTIRDASLWYYALFSIILSTFLVANADRFRQLISIYQKYIPIYMVMMPICKMLVNRIFPIQFPGSPVPLGSTTTWRDNVSIIRNICLCL